MFSRYIGVDYSGGRAPVSRLRALQVYASEGDALACAVSPLDRGARNWCRKEIALFIEETLNQAVPCIIGINHGFSFPETYFDRHQLRSWDEFLKHFCSYWPTDYDHMYVGKARTQNPPSGTNEELRLCETWAVGTHSAFDFEIHGSVAKSTHAGLPWLKRLREDPKIKKNTHFWPFDGFSVEPGCSVLVEVYPLFVRRRYPRLDRSVDQQDAYAVTTWLRDMDLRGALGGYFNPPLTLPERQKAKLEGWIFGVR